MSAPSPTERRRHAASKKRPGRYREWRARRKAHLAARSTLRRRLTRVGISLLVLVLVLVGGGAGYYFYRSGQVTTVDAPHVVPTNGPVENILLIGSTSRCAASAIAEFRQQCQRGVNGVNSDVVLIARLNGQAGTVSLLSIPRDTFVPGARSGSSLCGTGSALTPGTCPNKIDAALVEGPDQLIAAVEQDFGIPINHFVDLNFATFTNVVNALGGIKMYFPDRLFDASSGLRITRTGCQLLNGTQALELVRSRHLYWFTKGQAMNFAAIQAANDSGAYLTSNSGGQYDGTGDLGRIVRVHLFLKALATQVAARGLGNPFTDNNLIGAIAPNLTVDKGLSTIAMVHLALDFRHANLGSAPELTLPTINDAQAYYYQGYSYGDVIFPAGPQDQQVIDQFLGATPGASLAPSSIRVSVVDGTNSPTQTAAVASSLGALGYRVVPTTATSYVGPVSETTVLYNGKAHLAQAERVMRSLSGAVVLGQGVPAGGADVSVVAGSVLSVANPSHAATGGGTRTAGASTSTIASVPSTTTTTNPNLGTPTQATSAVPSYDPRSCP